MGFPGRVIASYYYFQPFIIGIRIWKSQLQSKNSIISGDTMFWKPTIQSRVISRTGWMAMAIIMCANPIQAQKQQKQLKIPFSICCSLTTARHQQDLQDNIYNLLHTFPLSHRGGPYKSLMASAKFKMQQDWFFQSVFGVCAGPGAATIAVPRKIQQPARAGSSGGMELGTVGYSFLPLHSNGAGPFSIQTHRGRAQWSHPPWGRCCCNNCYQHVEFW